MKRNYQYFAFMLALLNTFLLLKFEGVEAGDKGDDIILTKGKLIMRGGKGKGNLILDTGGKSNEHHQVMPMMPMMGHHFNPFSFYPMQQQHHHQPQMVIHPVYVEDHSAMRHHHQPEQHHEYHHEEPHYQHHGLDYQHHEPQHEIHHEPQHEIHHEPQHEIHHEPQHHEEQHYHEPMGQHYQHEGIHGHEGHHDGYESHPMVQMMMHGSGLQPSYQQLAAMQAYHNPNIYAQHQFQAEALQDQRKNQNQQYKSQQQHKEVAPTQHSKPSSLIDQAANNPLVAIIKPLFTRNKQQKKP